MFMQSQGQIVQLNFKTIYPLKLPKKTVLLFQLCLRASPFYLRLPHKPFSLTLKPSRLSHLPLRLAHLPKDDSLALEFFSWAPGSQAPNILQTLSVVICAMSL